jgi:beta-glucosidase
MEGMHAPGLKFGIKEVLAAGHNALLAHGKAVMVIRKYAKIKPVVGFAPVGICAFPDNNSEADINAAREATFAVDKKNCWNSSWWMEPVYNGKYPEEGVKLFGELMPEIKEGDMEIISQPLDFCGMNIYNGTRVRCGEDGKPETVKKAAGAPVTAIKWPVTPEALYWGPKFFYERYRLPVLITENGLSNTDWVSLDGKVHDPQRIDFLWRYLKEYRRAADDGVDLMGYFCWSVMDNFEWAEGYNERFGLVYIDYETGKRTIKDSGYWYRGVIESNGEEL